MKIKKRPKSERPPSPPPQGKCKKCGGAGILPIGPGIRGVKRCELCKREGGN
jgi:hypothetical protein